MGGINPRNGQRNAETPEELWKEHYVSADLRPEFEEGNQSAKDFVHDHLYLNKMLNQLMDDIDGDNTWHNSAFEFLSQDLSKTVIETLLREGPHQFESFLGGLFVTALSVGYLAGEGPEHIKKCRCKPIDMPDETEGIGNYL